uniref:START domain-containing protein n=1 Tax=Chromera velia CCMP2878 TaxID=1169474 RepID=A0A0G4G2G6_9ALVE|mmetsp:Transcript_7264/g.14224  ORF Transcript_7264/g.14224 Transcript_7264/m.14224 type:complete len:283 (-) Transcript_7264:580-1428(-)|eukprot:Cvel_19975.t1-p1 / transcript=Cvel_19975.t1 / gene=Cvel_19975 / organism=Chromera_velia_CCMP2878 / gene_product=hypothetical protein / transcript_product=hypothetical protein / location=Cvel_scaffold1759:14538-17759(+) / protein_length=282 / sequence_SO=supercontig / SO=protein_coding / is_pseudo=false
MPAPFVPTTKEAEVPYRVLQTAEVVQNVGEGEKAEDLKLRNIAITATKKNKSLENLMYYATLKDGWTSAGVHKGIECFRIWNEETKSWVTRGSLNFGNKYTPLDFLDVFRDLPRYLSCDQPMTKVYNLAEFCKSDYFVRAIYLSYRGQAVYSGRDMIAVQHVFFLDKKRMVLVTSSIDDQEWFGPVEKAQRNLVRAHMYFGGVLCETLDDGTLQCTYTANLELHTKLNKTLMQLAPHLLDVPQTLAYMKESMDKEGVQKSLSPLRPADHPWKDASTANRAAA